MNRTDSVNHILQGELLCIADSNWVLGHWYINCILNGRELTDFTSMAGIAEEKLGHARALFRFMEEYFELPEYQLEFVRSPEDLHSMELLDAPPRNWADFILTLYLADKALWRFSNTFRKGNFKPIANLVTKFGEEAYFHQLCIDGWLKALDHSEWQDLFAATPQRLPRARQWLTASEADSLVDAGIRAIPLGQGIESFDQDYAKLIASAPCQAHTNRPNPAIAVGKQLSRHAPWDPRRRRTAHSKFPPRLWESMVPSIKAAKVARRPLVISIDDNIDLFGKVKKDETEPRF